MDTLFNDLKLATRILLRSPVYAAVSVLTLALAIGANTAIFTVVHGVLIETLPYPEPDELIRVFESSRTYPLLPMSPANFLDYRASNDVIDGFALFMRDDLQLAESERPEQLTAMRVSHRLFGRIGGTSPNPWARRDGAQLAIAEASGSRDSWSSPRSTPSTAEPASSPFAWPLERLE